MAPAERVHVVGIEESDRPTAAVTDTKPDAAAPAGTAGRSRATETADAAEKKLTTIGQNAPQAQRLAKTLHVSTINVVVGGRGIAR